MRKRVRITEPDSNPEGIAGTKTVSCHGYLQKDCWVQKVERENFEIECWFEW